MHLCNKEHCRSLFTVTGKLQILLIKNVIRIVRISLGLVPTGVSINIEVASRFE